MSAQSEALRLARELEACPTINYKAHAAELRRLYDLAMEQQGKIYALEMARSMEQKIAALKRDALLEALKLSRAQWIHSVNSDHCLAAIKKAEENT